MRWIQERGPGLHGTFDTDKVRSRTALVRTILRRISGKPDGCIQWVGGLSETGYGIISVGTRANAETGRSHGIGRVVHRVVWELMHGALPHGMCLDHVCCNKLCVNTAHLDVVTSGENISRCFRRITHCSKGHEFTPDNTDIIERPAGSGTAYRRCRTCNRKHSLAYYHRNLEARRADGRNRGRAKRAAKKLAAAQESV